jgi:ribosomal protein S18 acetylase RimI-like enzyme
VKGSRVVRYRRFVNTDPPALVDIWNEANNGRGAVRLRTSSPLERHAWAKPYFDPAGVIVAEEDGTRVGFAHAGFGANAAESNVSLDAGVTCVVAVRPSHRRRGIGTELLQRCESYLRDRGVQTLYAGPSHPLDPFYLGLYGGSELPGFLASDPDAEPFLLKRGYQPCKTTLVWHRRLNQPLKIVDGRFPGIRSRFDLRVAVPPKGRMTWWQECVFGLVEPLEFYLEEKPDRKVAARAFVWEMDGLSARWGQHAVGISHLEVPPERRRQGLAKYLLSLILHYLQDQFYELVEMQVAETNEVGLNLLRGFGFEQVDVGRVYRKERTTAFRPGEPGESV